MKALEDGREFEARLFDTLLQARFKSLGSGARGIGFEAADLFAQSLVFLGRRRIAARCAMAGLGVGLIDSGAGGRGGKDHGLGLAGVAAAQDLRQHTARLPFP